MKVTFIPIVIGALSTVIEGLSKGQEDLKYIYLPNSPLRQDVTQAQFLSRVQQV